MTFWCQWLPAGQRVASREEHPTEDEAAAHVLRLNRAGIAYAVYFDDGEMTALGPEAFRTGPRSDAEVEMARECHPTTTRPREPQPCDSMKGTE